MNLLNRLNKNTNRDSKTGCWLWNLTKDRYGYGIIRIDGKNKRVHRLSAIKFLGLDPNTDLLACHKNICHNKNCWNPDHLYIGTHKDNMNDDDRKILKARCKQGHLITGKVRTKHGIRRYCVACNRLSNK